jgi:uncharacterized protein (DUF1778 family)
MATIGQQESPTTQLSFCLTPELKQTIEDAAAQLGQTVHEFGVATLVQSARQVIYEQSVTRVSQRDWEFVMALLDDETTEPNAALAAAAEHYKKQVG